MTPKLYYDQVVFESQTYLVASTDDGLAFVGSPNAGLEELQRFYLTADLVLDQHKNRTVMCQLKHYLEGNGDLSVVKLDITGTPFQEAVWDVLRGIPFGSVVTYQDIADKLGRPRAAQAVGNAVGKNPVLIVVPCHRVVSKSKQGSGYRGGMLMKEWLIAHEQNVAK